MRQGCGCRLGLPLQSHLVAPPPPQVPAAARPQAGPGLCRLREAAERSDAAAAGAGAAGGRDCAAPPGKALQHPLPLQPKEQCHLVIAISSCLSACFLEACCAHCCRSTSVRLGLQEEAAAFEAAYKASPEATGPTKWPRFAGERRPCGAFGHGGGPASPIATWLRVPVLPAPWQLPRPAMDHRLPLVHPHISPAFPTPVFRPLTPQLAEFLRDAYGGAVRDLSARIEERRKGEAAAAAQAAEVARLKAQQAEQRAATAESGASQLQARVGELERRLSEVQSELARERAAAAAAATRVATLQQQVEHLTQSKEAEARSLGQQAQAQLAAAQAAAQAEAASLRQQLEALQRQAAAAGAATQDAAGRVAALEAEKERLFESAQVLATEKAELQRAREVAEAQLAEVQRGRQAAERQLAEAQQRMQVGGGWWTGVGGHAWGM